MLVNDCRLKVYSRSLLKVILSGVEGWEE